MILIFSYDYDYSTNEVIKWLNFYEIPYIRINTFQEFSKKLAENMLDVNSGNSFNFNNIENKISCVWYRKSPINDMPRIENDFYLNQTISISCLKEHMVLQRLIIEELKNKYWLNHPLNASVNKIIVLKEALNIGLSIPPTLITSDKIILKKFQELHSEIITKPLFEVMKIEDKDKNKYMNRTSLVNVECIDSLNESFPSSLFQKKINKSFEVRTVYLEGRCYSMAIFSQSDEKTKIDFRYYDTVEPIRFCAIRLPTLVEEKVNKLMISLNLNFGSLDFIVDENNKYYFLEVNPVGQFGMTSTPNNYNIEKDVALLLKEKHNEFTLK